MHPAVSDESTLIDDLSSLFSSAYDCPSEIEDKEVATANKPVQIPDVPVNITMTKAVTVPPPKEDNTGSAAMALLIAQTGSSSTVAPATAPASAFSTVAVDVPKPSPKGDKPEGDKVETGRHYANDSATVLMPHDMSSSIFLC